MNRKIYVFIGTSFTNKKTGCYFANIYIGNEIAFVNEDLEIKNSSSKKSRNYEASIKAIELVANKINKIDKNKEFKIIFYVPNYDVYYDYENKINEHPCWKNILKNKNISIKYKDQYIKCIGNMAKWKH